MERSCKKICISIDEWIWNRFLVDVKGNKSSYIREYFIKGIELEGEDIETTKKKLLDKCNELNRANTTIRELENKLYRFRKGEREYDDDELKLLMSKKKMSAMLRAGVARNA